VAGAAFGFEEASIRELRAAMASGSSTSRGLTEAYLEQIETVDAALRSVLETNPDALEIADALDGERRSGHVRGALHGIPVLVKDNIDTADRMKTTAGSFALGCGRPARSSSARPTCPNGRTSARRVRAAGGAPAAASA
jgi:amidase